MLVCTSYVSYTPNHETQLAPFLPSINLGRYQNPPNPRRVVNLEIRAYSIIMPKIEVLFYLRIRLNGIDYHKHPGCFQSSTKSCTTRIQRFGWFLFKVNQPSRNGLLLYKVPVFCGTLETAKLVTSKHQNQYSIGCPLQCLAIHRHFVTRNRLLVFSVTECLQYIHKSSCQNSLCWATQSKHRETMNKLDATSAGTKWMSVSLDLNKTYWCPFENLLRMLWISFEKANCHVW